MSDIEHVDGFVEGDAAEDSGPRDPLVSPLKTAEDTATPAIATQARVVKFRMWHKGKMIPAGLRLRNAPDEDVVLTMEHMAEQICAIGSPLMQFTGLQDKNGRDIYEGDIVRNGGFICTVDYEAGAFQLVAIETSDEGCWDTLFDLCRQRRIDLVEVIGNIYEPLTNT